MKLEFSDQMKMDSHTRELTVRRLSAVLDRFSQRIGSVAIVARTTTGVAGAGDKACRVTAHLLNGNSITVSEQASDFLIAVSQVANRLGRAVARTLERESNPRITDLVPFSQS